MKDFYIVFHHIFRIPKIMKLFLGMNRYIIEVKLKILLAVLLFGFIFVGCSDDCENQNPSVVLVNNGTDKADIQIKTTGGNTENINNIFPGNSSTKRTFAPGDIEFTVTIQGVRDNVVYVLSAIYCTAYTVTINANNTVTGSGEKLEKIIYP